MFGRSLIKCRQRPDIAIVVDWEVKREFKQPDDAYAYVNSILKVCFIIKLTHLSLASLLWDIGKQHSPRCDAAERGVPSGAIMFAQRNFIEK